MITVDNKYTYKGKNGVDITRQGSCLGNPFFLKDTHDPVARAKVIAQYRVWLWKQMQDVNSPQSKELIRLSKLENVVLLCVCCPKHCHADVIKNAIEWIRSIE